MYVSLSNTTPQQCKTDCVEGAESRITEGHTRNPCHFVLSSIIWTDIAVIKAPLQRIFLLF